MLQIIPNRFVEAPGERPASNGASINESGAAAGRVVGGVERGRVVDWGVMEDAWRYMLYEQMGWEEGGEGAVLLCEPILTPRASRNAFQEASRLTTRLSHNKGGSHFRADGEQAVQRRSFLSCSAGRASLQQSRAAIDFPQSPSSAPFSPIFSHSLSCQADREQAAQVLFESFSCSGFFAAEQPVLALYALGRLSGCCVDLGHGKTDFSVVQEGALIPSSARRWPVGGCDLSERIQRLVFDERQSGGGAGQGGEVERDTLTRGSLSLDAATLERLKEEACEVALDEKSFAAARAADERKEFVLPDGQRISLGSERLEVAEALFRPSLLAHNSLLSPPSLEASPLAGPDSAGIVRQLLSVVFDAAGLGGGGGGGGVGGGMGGVGGGGGLGGGGMGVEGGKQRAALESIAVVGGGSCLKGLVDRFQSDVQTAVSPSLQPTVVRVSGVRGVSGMSSWAVGRLCSGAPDYMPDNTARYASWYGGAIVARIVFSQNQHVTRAEYNERGPAAVHRKSM
ncbi:unnamed protein product [Closterium sp. NIES-65]|nr:unnamed protein product [Closterium sp. NIES-65]